MTDPRRRNPQSWFDGDRVEAALNGDPEAMIALLEPLRSELAQAARRGMRPELRAKLGESDIVQDAMLDAMRRLGQFRGHTEAEWRAWMLAILRNRLAMVRRQFLDAERRRADREVSFDEPGGPIGGTRPEPAHPSSGPGAKAARKELEERLRAALDRLPGPDRDVVRWHHEERLRFDQIADRLGISAEAARKRWGRALVRLRDALGDGS